MMRRPYHQDDILTSQEDAVDIYFPDAIPTFSGTELQVQFTVIVNDVPLACAISSEALQDYFDAAGPFESALLAAFRANRHKIFSVCRAALKRNNGNPVVLRSGMFRFVAAASARADSRYDDMTSPRSRRAP